MIKVRKSIFETNSSSMHSFVLNTKGKCKVNKKDFEPFIKNGVLYIDMDGRYGRSNGEKITNQYERACYAAVSCRYSDDRDFDNSFHKLSELLMEELGVVGVKYRETRDDFGDLIGYIDHESQDLVATVGSFEDFIFGDGILYVDSDEVYEFDDEYNEIEKNPDLKRFY